jgi:hypothetical protein
MTYTVNPLSASVNFDLTEIELDTLDKQTGILPIGILIDDEWIKDYSFKPYLGKHHVTLGRLEDENEKHPRRLSRIYSTFLSEIIATIGDYPLDFLLEKFNLPASRFFAELYADDIVTMILSLRLSIFGEKVSLSTQCPYCDAKIRPDPEHDYHDLNSLQIGFNSELTAPPVVPIQGTIIMEPLRWGRINAQYFPEETRYLDALIKATTHNLAESSKAELDLENLHYDVTRNLENLTTQFKFGAERDIDMDCPECGANWKAALLPGRNHEEFYCSLLSPPRKSRKHGAVEEYLNEVAFFLRTGEQAPKVDPLEMTHSSLNFWVEKLSETYKKQNEEMKKSQAKSKSRR